ncbi:CLUMA_CG008729, isoform A [Clunio marinus]|uniref:CLUMA_CG008729, isoform A n=1 Tax=Clunio marinus TaxID=568069 RepID=A0A1J1I553_9DIPT|nr:CLUMA_CG008729, isoform A [Clunio marinus]
MQSTEENPPDINSNQLLFGFRPCQHILRTKPQSSNDENKERSQSLSQLQSDTQLLEDPEDPFRKSFKFTDESIRKQFVKKVYMILTLQIAITEAVVSLFVSHKPTYEWVRERSYLFWISLLIYFILMITLLCCPTYRRKSPINFILLGIFTIVQSFLMGVVSAVFAPELILLSAGITTIVCIGLTLFAFQSKFDFTIFRVFDTQMMIGTRHKLSLSPEEYIFAALTLYIDIVQIFVFILEVVGCAHNT